MRLFILILILWAVGGWCIIIKNSKPGESITKNIGFNICSKQECPDCPRPMCLSREDIQREVVQNITEQMIKGKEFTIERSNGTKFIFKLQEN